MRFAPNGTLVGLLAYRNVLQPDLRAPEAKVANAEISTSRTT